MGKTKREKKRTVYLGIFGDIQKYSALFRYIEGH